MHKSNNTISILIADDHEIFRDGFKVMLKKYPEIRLLGEAEDGAELLELAATLKPDVILTDIRMPRLDGIEATKELVERHHDIAIIALSMFDEDNLIMEMLEAGAKGYLLKNAHKEEIIEAIHTVHLGDNYYCKSTSAKLIKMIAKSRFDPYKHKPKVEFTEKEIEVIRLICEQMLTKEIAKKLNLSTRTIDGYREKIQEKMNVRNSAGVAVYAIKNGIYHIT